MGARNRGGVSQHSQHCRKRALVPTSQDRSPPLPPSEQIEKRQVPENGDVNPQHWKKAPERDPETCGTQPDSFQLTFSCHGKAWEASVKTHATSSNHLRPSQTLRRCKEGHPVRKLFKS